MSHEHLLAFLVVVVQLSKTIDATLVFAAGTDEATAIMHGLARDSAAANQGHVFRSHTNYSTHPTSKKDACGPGTVCHHDCNHCKNRIDPPWHRILVVHNIFLVLSNH